MEDPASASLPEPRSPRGTKQPFSRRIKVNCAGDERRELRVAHSRNTWLQHLIGSFSSLPPGIFTFYSIASGKCSPQHRIIGISEEKLVTKFVISVSIVRSGPPTKSIIFWRHQREKKVKRKISNVPWQAPPKKCPFSLLWTENNMQKDWDGSQPWNEFFTFYSLLVKMTNSARSKIRI